MGIVCIVPVFRTVAVFSVIQISQSALGQLALMNYGFGVQEKDAVCFCDANLQSGCQLRAETVISPLMSDAE